jgi:hypothetical protein
LGAWVEAASRFRAAVRTQVEDPAERDRLYALFAARTRAGAPGEVPRSGILADWLAWLARPPARE